MNIELLNVRIFITKNEVTVDAVGNHKSSWVPCRQYEDRFYYPVVQKGCRLRFYALSCGV